jgi:hypothetical protein
VRPFLGCCFNNLANAIVYRASKTISLNIFFQIGPLQRKIVIFIAQCGIRRELLSFELSG